MSALRRWLREELAMEHARDVRWHWGAITQHMGLPETILEALLEGRLPPHFAPRLREPNADLHKHGRDCDMHDVAMCAVRAG